MEIYIEIPAGHEKADAFGAALQSLLAKDQIEDRVLHNADIYVADRQGGVAEFWSKALQADGSRRLVIDTDEDVEFHGDPEVLVAAKTNGFLTLTIEPRQSLNGAPIETFEYALEHDDGKRVTQALIDGYAPRCRLSMDFEMKATGETKGFDLSKVEDAIRESVERLTDITVAITDQMLARQNEAAPAS